MDKMTMQEERQTSTERRILLIYFVYSLVLTALIVKGGWPIWLILGTDATWLCSLLVHIARYRDYQFRAYFTACLMQVNIMLWSMYMANLHITIPMLLLMAVVLVLYGIPQIIYIAASAATFLNIYHILIRKTVDFSTEDMVIQTMLEVFAVYFVQYVMCYINKKQIEDGEKQKQALETIKAVERSRDDFLANVSHEIRTPVNTICGMSEIVLREELNPGLRADIFSIQTAGRSLLSLVSDVLDFTELQSGKMALAEESYNITSTLNDIINMSMARISEKKLELVVDCHAGIPSGLLGDEQKIRRVIMNLVNNALKFTVEGCVTIAIYARETEYGINLVVSVRDTGIGIKEENQEKLFSSFNQVDTRRNRQEGGIGLGLAVSQAMVDIMGGFIKVSSEYGRGTEVQFVVPQKVVDSAPIVHLRHRERLNVAIYIDMDRFDRPDVRAEYGRVIYRIIGQLKVKCRICQNLAELKRRTGRERYTHIFISIEEYEEDREYFDTLSKELKLIAVIERTNDARIVNPRILRLYKPFFILPVVMILNDEKLIQGMDTDFYSKGKFIAPETSVLVVDDNLMNIRVLEGLLAPYKIKVSMATSGAEALEKIESMDYDVIFMDHMMPEMDGIETLHRIRQKQGNYYKKIPIIAVTANAVGGMREVFLSEGFQDFMAKPIEGSVMGRILRRNLPQEKLIYIRNGQEDGAEEAPGQEKSVPGSGTAPRTAERYTDLPPELFDEGMGRKYCGGLENYIGILQVNRDNGREDEKKLQHCFEERDWKNYTIYVHALKSSMLNIGVVGLSGMAKDMEQAGKRGDEEYILARHGELMSEYGRILELLEKSASVPPSAKKEDAEGFRALEQAEFERLALEFEDAAYSFDSDQMMKISEILAGCSYRGHSLREPMEPVMRKIEMSDYLSAAEAVLRLQEKQI